MDEPPTNQPIRSLPTPQKTKRQVPLTMHRVAQLLAEAGVPPGVFQIVNGTVDAVNALIDHPGIAGITFVGSSRVAEIVAKRANALNKRVRASVMLGLWMVRLCPDHITHPQPMNQVLALGGAKNHLIALPDCEPESASSDIVASFAGCCGQRCMAASVLVLVGENPALLEKVVAKAAALTAGVEPGQVRAYARCVGRLGLIVSLARCASRCVPRLTERALRTRTYDKTPRWAP